MARAAAIIGIDNKTETKSSILLACVELFIYHLRTAICIIVVFMSTKSTIVTRSEVESCCASKINHAGNE